MWLKNIFLQNFKNFAPLASNFKDGDSNAITDNLGLLKISFLEAFGDLSLFPRSMTFLSNVLNLETHVFQSETFSLLYFW